MNIYHKSAAEHCKSPHLSQALSTAEYEARSASIPSDRISSRKEDARSHRPPPSAHASKASLKHAWKPGKRGRAGVGDGVGGGAGGRGREGRGERGGLGEVRGKRRGGGGGRG